MQFTVNNEQELIDKVWQILEGKLKDRFVVGLIGDLGAGKTTLVKGILRKLDDSIQASSPTFTIVKSYDTTLGKINHIDLYRLGNDCSDPDVADALADGISLVEWYDYHRDQTKADVVIRIEPVDEHSRKVEIED